MQTRPATTLDGPLEYAVTTRAMRQMEQEGISPEALALVLTFGAAACSGSRELRLLMRSDLPPWTTAVKLGNTEAVAAVCDGKRVLRVFRWSRNPRSFHHRPQFAGMWQPQQPHAAHSASPRRR
jgi:hypothetical protein